MFKTVITAVVFLLLVGVWLAIDGCETDCQGRKWANVTIIENRPIGKTFWNCGDKTLIEFEDGSRMEKCGRFGEKGEAVRIKVHWIDVPSDVQ